MDNPLLDIAGTIKTSETAQHVGRELLELGASVAGPLAIAGVVAIGIKIISESFEQ